LPAADQVRADDQTEMQALVDKAVKAAGGKDKLARLAAATWKSKGRLNIKDETIGLTVDASWQGLDQCKLDLSADVMGRTETAILIINKKKGWLKVRDRVQEAPKDFLTLLKPDLYALRSVQMLLPLQDKTCKLSPLGELKIGDQETVGIKVTRKGYPDLDIFFDKTSMLAVKCQMMFKDSRGGQEVSHEFFFSAYKATDGLSHFTKVTFKRDGNQHLETEVSELQALETLDNGTFDKP
jgi:hypothetical protein